MEELWRWKQRLHCILSDLPHDQRDALELLFGEMEGCIVKMYHGRLAAEQFASRLAYKHVPLLNLAVCPVELAMQHAGVLPELPKGGLRKL